MKNILWMAGTGVALALSANAAFAQTTSGTVTVAEATEPGLEEIVVTAQRRSESLQRAGLAVDVVTGDALVQSGLTPRHSSASWFQR